MHAQLKIGANPVTISANTNMEVEAADGTKTVIKKDNGNVGIGTTAGAADNRLHVKATSDPIKLEGLGAISTAATKAGTLVADVNGVVKLETGNVKSAVSIDGSSVTIAANGRAVLTGNSSMHYDHLSEFSNGFFTPKNDGLYDIKAIVIFPQRSTNDVVDGYLGFVEIIPANTLVSGQKPMITSAKVPIPESGGYTASVRTLCAATYKLKAGESLGFHARTYGGGAHDDYAYSIQVTRLD
ncbi:hypothetical protein ABDK00_014575 [Niabella insulamsoli]|uniref:hypothetical protein n=1 Tax=Niabella insulamsoli TaxID=3144874 RepID=UPI0031FE414B